MKNFQPPLHCLLLAATLLAAACDKTPDLPEEVKDPELKSISVEKQQVVIPVQGAATILMQVDEPGFVFNYDITSPLCQVELRVQGTTNHPECYAIQSIAPAQSPGSYEVRLADKGIRMNYKEQAVLCLITSRAGYGKVMITTGAFEVISSLSKSGISAFSFTKSVNPALDADVELKIASTETAYVNTIEGNIPCWLDDLKLIATFTSGNTVKVNEVVQESGKTVNDFSVPVEYTVLTDEGTLLTYTVKVDLFTGLPVVIINTEGGRPVTSKEDWMNATIRIEGVDQFEDLPEMATEIRGRGNTTWFWPKKPYALKLESKTSLLGMPKHKRWVLLANFMDRTMLRNRIAFKIAQSTSLAWTPRNEIVELIFNGRHQGNYMLIEQIKEDKNRVNIGDEGYILELDFHFDNVVQWISPHGQSVQQGGIPFAVKFPDEEEITPAQVDWIKNYIDQAGQAIYGPDFADPQTGYRKYLDMQSFVDYWLVYELCINHELANPGSVYMYKDRDTKLFAGPTWDFDWGTFSYQASPQAKGILFMTEAIWYKQLFKDPEFRALAKERWNALKGDLEQIPAFLDREYERLLPSAELNFKMWDPAESRNINGGRLINGDEYLTYTQAVERMRGILVERLATLDEKINAL